MGNALDLKQLQSPIQKHEEFGGKHPCVLPKVVYYMGQVK